MIPRKLAYRIWSDCLAGRAASLHALADHGAGRATAAWRAAAEDLAAAAHQIGGWSGDKHRCHGADVEPEVIAWLCAFIAGDTRAPSELARLCPGWTEGVAPRDFPALIERLLA